MYTDAMALSDSNRDHKLDTKLGPVYVTPTSGNHLFVDANHHSLSPQSRDHHPPLMVNGVPYGTTIHYYLWADGRWHIGPEQDGQGGITRHGSLHASRGSGRYATDAARRRIDEVITPVVNEWAQAHPQYLVEAAKDDREQKRERLEAKITEHLEAVEVLRKQLTTLERT